MRCSLLRIVLIVFFFAPAAAAGAQLPPAAENTAEPTILSVHIDEEEGLLIIMGESLGRWPGEVFLGADRLEIERWAPWLVVARLPEPCDPGSYLLRLELGPGVGTDLTLTFAVACGAEGPQGPQGPPGTTSWTDGDGEVTTTAKVGINASGSDSALAVSNGAGGGVEVSSAAHGVTVSSAGLDGVHVSSAANHGVFAQGGGNSGDYGGEFRGFNGLLARAQHGLGYSIRADGGKGLYATIQSDRGFAVWGDSRATSPNWTYGVLGTTRNTQGAGVLGYGVNTSGGRVGVMGMVDFDGYGLYTPDNLLVLGSIVNAPSSLVARNASGETLETGDVVVVAGAGPALRGQDRPVLEVRPAACGDRGILGVVYSRGEAYPAPEEENDTDVVHPTEGDVAPDEFLLVVMSGLAQVRVAEGLERLEPGQYLTVAELSGCAKAATAGTPPDSVLGRAVDAYPNSDGLVWALVSAY